MDKLTLGIDIDDKYTKLAIRDIRGLICKYPLIANEVTNNISDYIEVSIKSKSPVEVSVVVNVAFGIYKLISSLYDVEFIEVTTINDMVRKYREIKHG